MPTALNEYAGSATGETARSYFLRNGGRNDDARINCLHLLRRIYPLQAGMTVLIHAAAGGLGLIFCQWAKLLGTDGHRHRFNRREGGNRTSTRLRSHHVHARDVPKRVREITNGEGVPVVYDSVGKDTFAGPWFTTPARAAGLCWHVFRQDTAD